MQYTIIGKNMPALQVSLSQGESMYTQSGGMAWMGQGIDMETNMKGGFLKSLGRMVSGDSLFMATYTCTAPSGEIAFVPNFIGTIQAVEVGKGPNIICQKSAFLCAQPTVDLAVVFAKKFSAGLFGGEGFLLQKLSGSGMAFLELDGDVVSYDLQPGQVMRVDTGHIAAFEESVAYEIETVKGFKNVLFGGEGLFLAKLTGPGKIWLQTFTLPGFAQTLIPFLPKNNSNS